MAMLPRLSTASDVTKNDSVIFIIKDDKQIPHSQFSPEEIKFIQGQLKDKKHLISINQYNRICFIYKIEAKKEAHLVLESCRKNGDIVSAALNRQKYKSAIIADDSGTRNAALAFAEG